MPLGLKIGAPSKSDYADKSRNADIVFKSVPGFAKPHEKAAPVGEKLPRLNDGDAAQNNDDVDRSVWMDGGEWRVSVDLKKPLEIGGINVFSWHKFDRAPQGFAVFGATGDSMPDAGAKPLDKNGWTKIAEVDTSPLKNDGMHASSIFDPTGAAGKYRYLLFKNTKQHLGTFLSEIDIYEKGSWSTEDPGERQLKQMALLSLGEVKDAAAAGIISDWLDKLAAGNVNANLQLDVLEAAGMRSEEKVTARLTQYQHSLKAHEDDKLAPYRVTLTGGDVKCGEELFRFHAAACIRCHKLGDGHEGGDAGPNLAGVGQRLTREKLLESLIDPNAEVVTGFGHATLRMKNGQIVTGGIVKEDEKEITLKNIEGKTFVVPAGDVVKRLPAVSPMPTMETVLKPREMRDLIEYLATQK